MTTTLPKWIPTTTNDWLLVIVSGLVGFGFELASNLASIANIVKPSVAK